MASHYDRKNTIQKMVLLPVGSINVQRENCQTESEIFSGKEVFDETFNNDYE